MQVVVKLEPKLLAGAPWVCRRPLFSDSSLGPCLSLWTRGRNGMVPSSPLSPAPCTGLTMQQALSRPFVHLGDEGLLDGGHV